VNQKTKLLRQVHPSFVQEGRISSQVFRPTPKDRKQLSVYDGDLTTAAEAFTHYTETRGLSSAGTVAVSIAECDACSLQVASDPEPFPEHALIDFSPYSEPEIRRKAKQLAANARARGWLHRAEAD
jgi:hypothetical protein